MTDYAYRRMEQLYHFIEAYQFTHLRPPTCHELGKALHYSPRTIQYWLGQMRRLGWIERRHWRQFYEMKGIPE